MDLNKICISLIVLILVLSISCIDLNNNNAVYGAETWIKENQTSVGISGLTATIHVHIKKH